MVDPRTSYAMAKRYNEIYLASHHEERGINVISIRFFNVYGWNQDNRMVVPRFFEQCKTGEDITVFGSGDQTRDFTYIDDIVDGTISALDRVNGYEILNLGNHRSIRLDSLIKLIGQSCGKEVEIQRLPAPAGDVSKTCASIEKSARVLDYSPSTSIEEGIDQFVSWFNTENQQHLC